jgi:F-type H+-transporting ATPase subunit delta
MNKLDAQKIAGRYAKALYEAAVEQGQIETSQADVAALTALFETEPRLSAYFNAPLIPPEDKATLIEAQFAPKLQSAVVKNGLKLILESHRIGLLSEILVAFTQIEQDAKGIVNAEVTVAGPTPEATLTRLRTQLENVFQLKEVRLHVTEDPAILAGAIVRIHGKVLDGSYRNKLQQARKHASA